MRLVSVILLTLLLALPACETLSGGAKTSDADLEQRIIDTDRLLELVGDAKKPAVLIDVRSPEKYAAGHIPGAINIPLPYIRPADDRLAEAHALIVTGDGWTDILTNAATKKLISQKYGNVYDYRGGIELWRQEGRSLVEGTEPGTLR